MRGLAELFAEANPTIACAHGIDAGDALALATRFDRQWGYRGGEALFWSADVHAHVVHDRTMAVAPLRPFDRRGLLLVNATYRGASLTLVAASLGEDRAARIRDLRFARTVLREIAGNAIAFVGRGAQSRIGFGDLGFAAFAHDDYNLIVVRPSHETPPPHTAGSQDASASIARI